MIANHDFHFFEFKIRPTDTSVYRKSTNTYLVSTFGQKIAWLRALIHRVLTKSAGTLRREGGYEVVYSTSNVAFVGKIRPGDDKMNWTNQWLRIFKRKIAR